MSARPNDPALLAEPVLRESVYETRYHAFSPALVKAARAAKVDMTLHLKRLNKVAALCAGMGVVARIIAGNCVVVVADMVDRDDPNGVDPLRPTALSHLQNMMAELCEHIYEDISIAADKLRREVAA